MLLDLGGTKDDPFQAPAFNNGHANGNLFDFIERPPNGKAPHASGADDLDDDEDDSEALEQAGGTRGDDAHALPKALLSKNNPFGEDLELQRQQTSEFDPENEPRHETPTPPADEVPGVIGLVSDNVAESGEESEDEWNYYKVDPSDKSQEPAVKEQQAKPEVCPEQPLNTEESDMESQLNPNAAEFIPSPTHNMPSMEEILSKGQPKEEDSFLNSTISSVNTSDLLCSQDDKYDENLGEFSTSQKDAFVNPLTAESDASVEESFDGLSSALNESAAFSTKAEFGDESTTSGAEFQKIIDSSSNIMESSLTGQDFLASDEQIGDVTLDTNVEPSVLEQESVYQQDIISDFQKEPVHISFQLQKEIAPQMESQPERIKVDSEDQSPTLDSEPELELTNDLSEMKIADNVDFTLDISANQVSTLAEVSEISKLISQDLEIDSVEDAVAEKMEEVQQVIVSPKTDEFDLLKEGDSKSFRPADNQLELNQTVEKADLFELVESPPFIESNVQVIDSKVEISPQISESPLSELTDELAVQVGHQLISNEVSTPEYEKLEKDLEASEQYQNQFNIAKNDIPINLTATTTESYLGAASDDVLLESAHPDKVALLDDACVDSEPADNVPAENVHLQDFSYSNGPLNEPAPESDLLEPIISEIVPSSAALDSTVDPFIQSEVAPITESVPEVMNIPSTVSNESSEFEPEALQSSPFNSQAVETLLKDTSIVTPLEDIEEPAHIPAPEITPIDAPVSEPTPEAIQTPPPTPQVIQFEGDQLSLDRGTGDFMEVVQKLSATQESSEQRGLEEVEKAVFEGPSAAALSLLTDDISAPSPTPAAETTAEPEIVQPAILEHADDVKPLDDQSLTEELAATDAVAGGVAVATVAAAAVASVAATPDKEAKKEKDASGKKPAVALKDKKPSSEKPKAIPPKTTVSSRLTSAAKPKSPTSPMKPPVASKTAAAKPSPSLASKPLAKNLPPKTSRPLSSVPARATTTTTTTTAPSKPKPAGSQQTTRPTPPGAGLPKTRPASALEKKTVTNGDIKATSKRPEPLPAKTTASKLSQRPTSAPATKAVSKTVSSVTSTITKTKSPLNGPSKPKSPASSVTQVKSVAKASNEKEIKETANKQISTRTTTSTVRSTTTTMASKTSVTSALRKTESKVLTNGKGPTSKPSSLVKTSTTASSRLAPKKPATTTHLKATKTESIIEKSETLQGTKTVVATKE